MENMKRKEDLSLIYKMCMRDLEKAKSNLENYIKKVDEMFSYFFDTINNCSNVSKMLAVYDAILSDLTSLSDTTRKFNISCELKTFKYDEVCFDEQNLSLTKSTKAVVEQKERFTYPRPDTTKYENGYEGSCVITYVKDKEQKLFYINEMNNKNYAECTELLRNYFSKPTKKYNRMPKEGELFGLYIKKYLLRAVRENDQYNKNKPVRSFNAYLIDIGEIVEITIDMDIYFLPHECTKYPARAVLCKLEMIDFNTSNVEKYFSNILYIQQKFVVLSKDDFFIRINLVSNTNPFLDCDLEDENAYGGYNNDYYIGVVNPFRQYYCVINENDDNVVIDNDNDNFLSVDDVNTNYSISNNITNNTQKPLTLATSSSSNNNNGNNFKLNDDLSLLLQNNVQFSLGNFKSFNNDCDYNAIQQNDLSIKKTNAIKGTTICDDENLKYLEMNKNQNNQQDQSELISLIKRTNLKDYYNDVINKPSSSSSLPSSYCDEFESTELNIQQQKNSQTDSNRGEYSKNLKQISINLLPELNSFTTNQNNAIVKKCVNDVDDDRPVHDINDKFIYPSAGSIVTLIPTHVINIELFFAHIYSHESRYQITLGELIRKMNVTEQIAKYKMIKRPLETFELVIAKYKDGYWYRARVISIYDEINVKVFYVDYGNADVITIHQIRKWEKNFEFLPFQAIRCQIYGIRSRSLSIIGLEHLKKLILNNSLRAKIMNKLNGNLLDVKLTDSNGCDIANQLILMGYAYKK